MEIAIRMVCPLYQRPGPDSQRVDEVLYGWSLTSLGSPVKGWVPVRTHYGYEGWMRQTDLLSRPDTWEGNGWITAPFADVLTGPEVECPVLATLPRGGMVCRTEGDCPEGWCQVRLPDGREGYLKAAHLTPRLYEPLTCPEEELRALVVERAASYLGVQYRWGGKSPLGIDCSGLTFMAWMFGGVTLYRDAKLVEGYAARPIPPETCKPADLLYFPGHVALCLGGGAYLHATAREGKVVVGSLNPEDSRYRADLAGQLLTGGTVFPLHT